MTEQKFTFDPELVSLDLTGAEIVHIEIRDDGSVIWINTEHGCKLRICQIKKLAVIDGRRER